MKELELYKGIRSADKEKWLKLAQYLVRCKETGEKVTAEGAANASGYSLKGVVRKIEFVSLSESQGLAITANGTFVDTIK